MKHSLSIERVYSTTRHLHGAVRLLSGYVGECGCGASSQLYGTQEPCRQWFAWHTDPTGRRARAVRGGIR
jgi:hypothetical protein